MEDPQEIGPIIILTDSPSSLASHAECHFIIMQATDKLSPNRDWVYAEALLV